MHGILGDLYYNVDFSVAALLVDLILFAYVRTRYQDTSFSNKIYKRLVIIALVGSIFNIAGAVTLTYYKFFPEFFVLLVNAIYYHLFLTLAFAFAEYIESYFYRPGEIYRRSKLNVALYIAGVILIYALVFTGNVFNVTEKGIDYLSPRYFLYVFPLYFVTFAVMEFIRMRRRVQTSTIARIMFAGGIATFLMTLQTTFAPETLLSDIFIALALLIFYYSLESPEMLDNLSTQTMMTLAGTIDARDSSMTGHSFRVADVAKMLAVKLGISERESEKIYRIGLLHDIGKIGVSDAVLYNKGSLSDNEYEQAKMHTVIGDTILTHITELPELRQGARWHHERFDGKGYPDGLKGEDIPLSARIICVADAYDAMVAKRRYGGRLSQEEAKQELKKGSGTQFDPLLVEKMIEIIDEDKDFSLNGDKHMDEFRMGPEV